MVGRSARAVLLVALLVCGASAQANCNLRCWLRKLVVNVPEITKDGATITNLTITGLDLGGLSSSKPTSTSFQFKATGLAATISMHADYNIIHVTVGASVKQSTADVTISLGTSSDGLLDSASLDACSISLTISELDADLGWVGTLLLKAFKSVIISILEDVLPGVLCKQVLPPLVDTNATQKLSEFAAQLRPYLRPTSRQALPEPEAGMRSMHKNGVVDMLDWAANRLVGTRGINWVVQRLTNGTGVLTLADINAVVGAMMGSPYDAAAQMRFHVPFANLTASMDMGITALRLGSLVSADLLDVLVPDDVDQYSLRSRTGLAHLGINASFFVNVSTQPGGTVSTSEPAWLYEQGGVHIETSRNRLEAYTRVLVSTAAARSINHNQLTDLNCVVSVLRGASIDYLSLNTSLDVAELLPLSGDIEADLDAVVSSLASTLIAMYKPVVPAFLNGVLVNKTLGFVNPIIVGLLADRTCAVKDEGRDFGYRSDTTAAMFVALECFGALLVAVCVVLLAVLRWRKRDAKEPGTVELDTVSTVSAASDANGSYGQQGQQQQQGGKPRRSVSDKFVLFLSGGEGGEPCLMCDPRINIFVRALIPIVLLSDIALFFSSNTGIGASVVLQLEWQSAGSPDHVLETAPVSSFGLVDSIRDMWKAKVYPLSILIGVFSGAWPYIKLIAALACWSVPSQALNSKWRGRLLVALDMLGKWSLLDAYVMTIMIVSFHFYVPFGTYDSTATDRPLSLSVLVLPCWGFISFLIATIISLVTSHFVLFFHKQVEAAKHPDPKDAGLDAASGKPVRTPVMLGFLDGRAPLLAWSGRAAISALMIVTMVLVLVGGFILSIAFEFRGAAGVALEGLLNMSATREYSLVDVGVSVPKSSPNPSAFGPVIIVIVYLLTALIIPVLHMLAMLVLWCAPLTLRQQRWGLTVVEVCNAWACIDVYIVSMAAALLEIRQFAGFMVGDRCDGINRVLEQYFAQDLEGHNICFEVIAKLTPGSWPLIVSIFFYFFCTLIVMRVCDRVIKRRIGKADDDDDAHGHRRDTSSPTPNSADSPNADRNCPQTPSPQPLHEAQAEQRERELKQKQQRDTLHGRTSLYPLVTHSRAPSAQQSQWPQPSAPAALDDSADYAAQEEEEEQQPQPQSQLQLQQQQQAYGGAHSRMMSEMSEVARPPSMPARRLGAPAGSVRAAAPPPPLAQPSSRSVRASARAQSPAQQKQQRPQTDSWEEEQEEDGEVVVVQQEESQSESAQQALAQHAGDNGSQ
eukprot:m51a1_g7981 hypothetical protein (1259) ;mRNA; f:59901-63961